MDPVDRSEAYLLAVRRGEETADIEATLAGYDSAELATALDTDAARLAFWINIYNAVTQTCLATDPDRYEDRRSFFTTPLVTVAGKSLSLDDIEHDILRRSYSKFTFGYLRNPFRGSFARQRELDERDSRIHFALNCGAESCPPIAAYTAERIDDQLDWATEGYLDQTVEYDADAETVRVPRVMLWFRGDFGRKADILHFLRSYDQIPADAAPSLSYREWNWSLTPEKYVDDETAPVPDQD